MGQRPSSSGDTGDAGMVGTLTPGFAGIRRGGFEEPAAPRQEESARCRWTHRLRSVGNMAYDEDLAVRIRELVAKERGLSERKMFGGLAFLVDGNMAIAASGQGGILVRVDPEQSDKLVATTKASVAVMQGRAMPGWLRVDSIDVRTKPQLSKWVKLGTTFARTLPAKG
jgi:TfoX/Sxy family transcriptional regulator of competence genes